MRTKPVITTIEEESYPPSKDAFKINSYEDMEITEFFVGNEKTLIVYIDNIYVNPMKVRDYALSLHYTSDRSLTFGAPLVRAMIRKKHLPSNPNYSQLIGKFYKDRDKYLFNNSLGMSDNSAFQFIKSSREWMNDCWRDEGVRLGQSFIPHVDHAYGGGKETYGAQGQPSLVSFIYLNTDAQCAGGTAFYRFKPTQSEKILISEDSADAINYTVNKGAIPLWYQNKTDSKYWEYIGATEMKFNRMIIYPENLWHNPYMEQDDFNGDYRRLVQSFFS